MIACRISAIVLLMGLVLAGVATLVSGPAAAQEAREIEHQGVKRALIVTNAAAAKDAPRPLMVVLHGRRQVTQPHRSSATLDALAIKEGFVVAYPAALGGKWNYVGETTPPSLAGAVPADDLAFLTLLIEMLVAEKAADPSRIYISGSSQGAFMTYSLVCLLSERIAAAAPLIASMTEAQMGGCQPKRAVPLLVIAGTHDRIVPYDGWLTPAYRLTSVPETLEFWRKRHACAGLRSIVMPKRTDAEPTRTHVLVWTGCALDGALKLYRVEGGGHTLPSLVPRPAGEAQNDKMGPRGGDFETSHEVWNFLKQWSL